MEPAFDELAVADGRRTREAPEDEPPALSRFRDCAREPLGGRAGIGVHVC
jgi:hypothetical protein